MSPRHPRAHRRSHLPCTTLQRRTALRPSAASHLNQLLRPDAAPHRSTVRAPRRPQHPRARVAALSRSSRGRSAASFSSGPASGPASPSVTGRRSGTAVAVSSRDSTSAGGCRDRGTPRAAAARSVRSVGRAWSRVASHRARRFRTPHRAPDRTTPDGAGPDGQVLTRRVVAGRISTARAGPPPSRRWRRTHDRGGAGRTAPGTAPVVAPQAAVPVDDVVLVVVVGVAVRS